MSDIITTRFDYTAVSADVAADAKTVVAALRDLQKRTTLEMAEVGLKIISIRDRLERGQFLKWVESEVGSKSTAYRCIDLASVDPSILPSLGSLGITAAYAIAAAATPAGARDEIISIIKSGAELSAPDAMAMVRAAKRKDTWEKNVAEAPVIRKREREKEEQRRRAWAKEKAEAEAAEAIRRKNARQAAAMIGQLVDADILHQALQSLVRADAWDFLEALKEQGRAQ